MKKEAILSSLEDSEKCWVSDSEVVCDGVTERGPVLLDGVAQEGEDLDAEGCEGSGTPVMGDCPVHRPQSRSIGFRWGQWGGSRCNLMRQPVRLSQSQIGRERWHVARSAKTWMRRWRGKRRSIAVSSASVLCVSTRSTSSICVAPVSRSIAPWMFRCSRPVVCSTATAAPRGAQHPTGSAPYTGCTASMNITVTSGDRWFSRAL